MPLDDPNEYFYLVDENDKEIGKIKRSEAHASRKKIHRSSYVVVTNSKKELLLQKRSMKKDLQPGFWGMSVGGHVTYGQTYKEAAEREIQEELGISLPLTFVVKKLISSPEEIEYSSIFSASTDKTPVDFDRDEIDEVRWVPIKKLKEFVGREKVSNGAKSVIKILTYI